MDDVDKKIEHKISERLEQRIDDVFTNKLTEISNTRIKNRKNIVISCVSESVFTIIRKFAKQINFLQDGFIDNCFRVDKKADRNAKMYYRNLTIYTSAIFRTSRDIHLHLWTSVWLEMTEYT